MEGNQLNFPLSISILLSSPVSPLFLPFSLFFLYIANYPCDGLSFYFCMHIFFFISLLLSLYHLLLSGLLFLFLFVHFTWVCIAVLFSPSSSTCLLSSLCLSYSYLLIFVFPFFSSSVFPPIISCAISNESLKKCFLANANLAVKTGTKLLPLDGHYRPHKKSALNHGLTCSAPCLT